MKCENGHYYSGSYCKICGTKPENKAQKPIARVSKKRLKQEYDYKKLRDAYLLIFPKCEVHNCDNKSSQIHHRQGRIGALLTDVNHFLAVCEPCHKYIELNPIWSKEQGYSESRI